MEGVGGINSRDNLEKEVVVNSGGHCGTVS